MMITRERIFAKFQQMPHYKRLGNIASDSSQFALRLLEDESQVPNRQGELVLLFVDATEEYCTEREKVLLKNLKSLVLLVNQPAEALQSETRQIAERIIEISDELFQIFTALVE